MHKSQARLRDDTGESSAFKFRLFGWNLRPKNFLFGLAAKRHDTRRMSHYRGPAYPPRKRPRGGFQIFLCQLIADYYDGWDRHNRGPRQTPEESTLSRIRKDFISLADQVFAFPVQANVI